MQACQQQEAAQTHDVLLLLLLRLTTVRVQ